MTFINILKCHENQVVGSDELLNRQNCPIEETLQRLLFSETFSKKLFLPDLLEFHTLFYDMYNLLIENRTFSVGLAVY